MHCKSMKYDETIQISTQKILITQIKRSNFASELMHWISSEAIKSQHKKQTTEARQTDNKTQKQNQETEVNIQINNCRSFNF